MANRISIGGVGFPGFTANSNYTFAGFVIGGVTPIVPLSGGAPESGDGTSGTPSDTPDTTPPETEDDETDTGTEEDTTLPVMTEERIRAAALDNDIARLQTASQEQVWVEDEVFTPFFSVEGSSSEDAVADGDGAAGFEHHTYRAGETLISFTTRSAKRNRL